MSTPGDRLNQQHDMIRANFALQSAQVRAISTPVASVTQPVAQMNVINAQTAVWNAQYALNKR